MLSYALCNGLRAEYRGMEPDGLTWWRYPTQVDPNVYREQCLRVIRKI